MAHATAQLPSHGRYFPSRYTEVLQVTVIDVNMRSWTVDVAGKLTGRYWADVQAGSPYLHQNSGEGIYCMPEVGAVCMLCIPTDTSGPFIMSYISPGQTTNAGEGVDAAQQGMTGSDDQDYSKPPPPPNKAIDYSYSSNRAIAKPGDIVIQGRDGNFCKLHRGGALEIGSSELSKRIYIPLTNMVTDISERYEHHNAAGTVRWGMQALDYTDRETWWRQCFRVFADDKYCDVRLTVGNVLDPCKLPDGDEDLDDIPTEKPVVYEIALIPSGDASGFKGIEGETVGSSQNQLKMMFRFDRKGNVYARFDGNALLAVKKDLFIKVKGDLKLEAKSISMTTTGDATLGADGVTNIKGSTVKLAGGGPGVARLMDMVMIPGAQLVLMLKAMGVSMVNESAGAVLSLQGAITTCSSKVEAT